MNGPLGQLVDEHRLLDQALARHQVRLVEGRWPAALSAWQGFAGLLLGHMHAEEERVLPAYEDTVTPTRGGEASIFRREHLRLRRLLEELGAWLAAWRDLPWAAEEVIHLLERQKTLKEILEHHDQRERDHLYAGLRQALPQVQQEELVTAFRAAETEAPAPAGGRGGPQEAALLAAAWLTPLYRELEGGQVRPRREAPWGEARRRLEELAAALRAGDRPPLGVLQEMAALLDRDTPLNRFPASRGSQVHACWHLLQAAMRAARAASLQPGS